MTETHLSRETYERLSAELQELTTVGRTQIAQAIEAARNLGDLSENGDYHAAKDEQGRMEGRIRQLTAMLENAQLVEDEGPTDAVRPGATVSAALRGRRRRRDLLPRVDRGAASRASRSSRPRHPSGIALLDGRKKGDTVEYETPTGAKIRVEIVGVS